MSNGADSIVNPQTEFSSAGSTSTAGEPQVSNIDDRLIKIESAIEQTEWIMKKVDIYNTFSSFITLIITGVVAIIAFEVSYDYFHNNPERFEHLMNYIDSKVQEELSGNVDKHNTTEIWFPYSVNR